MVLLNPMAIYNRYFKEIKFIYYLTNQKATFKYQNTKYTIPSDISNPFITITAKEILKYFGDIN